MVNEPVTHSRLAVQVTQAAFVVRLIAIIAALLASIGERITLPTMVILTVAAGTSYLGLARTDILQRVTKHPSLAIADLLLLAGATAIGGASSPFALAMLSTAVLLGLWVDLLPGVLVIVSLLGLYVLGIMSGDVDPDTVFLQAVILPFAYLMFWYLGMTIRRSLASEASGHNALRDAIVTASATEERNAIARQLHDSLAKTLQGMVLATSSLPTYIDRDSDRAKSLARDVQHMAGEAVHQVRGMMATLRERTSSEPLPDVVRQVVVGWESRTGRTARVTVEESADTPDEAVRYELLHILEEALDNVHRHAGPCETQVELTVVGDQMNLIVADTGNGVADEQLERAAEAGHLGVKGFHERMARIGGWVTWSSSPGRGTRVVCTVHREGLVER